MEIIREFEKLNKSDVLIAGGKGASLGEMTNIGIPIPPGFVILSTAFERFLEETDLNVEIDAVLDEINIKEIHTIENASEKIQAMIFSKELPGNIKEEILNNFKKLNSEFVAVRSSATSEDSASAAWAGQLESYLNTTKETLFENIKKCWASLFSPRAIFYRLEKKLDRERISVAVVVQKMIESEKSGIAFSVHPITQDENQIIIEAGFGLGESIVSGQITPDSYVIEKNQRKIIDKNIETQSKGLYLGENNQNEWQDISEEKGADQTLSDNEILELSELILKVENHFGFPCDIEWAFKKGKFYILQSRPITTISSRNNLNNGLDISKEYQRLFKVKGLRFFMSSIWMKYYKNLKILVTFYDDTFTSYILKNSLKKTLDDGLVLLSSKSEFEKYESEFREYIRQGDKLANSIDYNSLSELNVSDLIKCAAGLYYFYSKTEFFYTDKAFLVEKETKNEILEKNLHKIESIKNDGREFLTRFFFGEEAYLNKLLKGLNLKFNIPIRKLQQYSPEEIISLFNSKVTLESVIKNRDKSFYILGNGVSAKIEIGEQASKEIENFNNIQKEKRGENIISGVKANGGKVMGVVHSIIYDYDKFDQILADMEKMKQGEILVAETTSPELVMACKKAAAIVTDQGGMLSHAAIISRELDIPCIVGTGNATEILKTGDKVEINADNGFIKIIKKFEE